MDLVIVSVTTVVFGITSLILISRARKKLSDGSIRRYLDNFAICLAFIVIFSVWQTARTIFGVNIDINGLGTYPEYIFIVFAYLAFIIASFRVMKISEEFGFREYGNEINQILIEKSQDSAPKDKPTNDEEHRILRKKGERSSKK